MSIVFQTTQDDYTPLKAQIATWMKRTDLTAVIPSFISLAENVFLRELSLRITETSISGTTTAATIAFPSGYDRIERIEVVSNNVKYTLAYTSPNGIEPLTDAVGLPSRYTVENGSIRLIRAPDSAYSYTLYYIPNMAALSVLNPSNWVSTNAPDVYLYGALSQACGYTLDDEGRARYEPQFQSAIASVRTSDEARRLPISGGLQIKPRNTR